MVTFPKGGRALPTINTDHRELEPPASLQPALHQFRRPPVDLVRAPFDVGDAGQVLEFPAPAFHRGRRLRCSVGSRWRRDHRPALRLDHRGFRVGVDGVAVGVNVRIMWHVCSR